MFKNMTISQVAQLLTNEVGTEISEVRLRSWEPIGLSCSSRTKQGYREFSKKRINELRIIAILATLNIDFSIIKGYMKNPSNPEIIATIIRHITILKNLMPKIEKNIGKLTLANE